MHLPKLLDCTLRDGGYINNWNFSRDFGDALYRAVSAAGVDYVEVGFLEPGVQEGLPWTNLSADDLNSIRGDLSEGTAIAVMINYGAVALEDIPEAKDYPADLIRVAAPKSAAEEATAFAAAITQKGYRTTINYMGISNYTNQEILSLVDLMNRFKDEVEYFYVADSFGSLMPKRTREIFGTLRFGTDAALGFHPHNNLQLAFANCLEAMEAGVDIIDGSVFGMGRGAGNLFTDAMLAYYEQCEPERYHLVPVLQFADLYMEELKKEFTWGYSLPQLLSGILKCHPNYPTNLLKEKAYTADDIFSMLQGLSDEKKPRYSKESLQSIRVAHFGQVIANAVESVSPEMAKLCERTEGKALLICGGSSVVHELGQIEKFVQEQTPSVFSINNPKPPLSVDGVFFGNRRRFLRNSALIEENMQVILGLEVHALNAEMHVCGEVSKVNALAGLGGIESPFELTIPANSAIEGVLALVRCGYRDFHICGLDGYANGDNYYYEESDQLNDLDEMARENVLIQQELRLLADLGKKLGFSLTLMTQSRFEIPHE